LGAARASAPPEACRKARHAAPFPAQSPQHHRAFARLGGRTPRRAPGPKSPVGLALGLGPPAGARSSCSRGDFARLVGRPGRGRRCPIAMGCGLLGLSIAATTDTGARGGPEPAHPFDAVRLAAVAGVGLLAGATGRPIATLSHRPQGRCVGGGPWPPKTLSVSTCRRRSIPERKKSVCRKRISLTVSLRVVRVRAAPPARPRTHQARRRLLRPRADEAKWRHASAGG
jgi:hypothetical protein